MEVLIGAQGLGNPKTSNLTKKTSRAINKIRDSSRAPTKMIKQTTWKEKTQNIKSRIHFPPFFKIFIQ